MNKKFIEQIKNLLSAQKKETVSKLQQEVIVDMEGDETDLIQGNLLAEINSRLNSRASAKLKQIEEALSRIDKKTYGLCQDCGEAIPEKRLIINPHFQTCVSCAEDRETEEKQRKKF